MGCVISTCGTSILTNTEKRREQNELSVNRLSNKREEELSSEEKSYLDGLLDALKKESQGWDVAAAKRGSAELNSLLAYYSNQVSNGAINQHYFISSDTYVGKECAKVVANWWAGQGAGFHAELYSVPELTTADALSFRGAMDNLAKWCAESVEPMRGDPHYVVSFNLTGGFKSVQGFMQTLGMFYADETFYQFQGSDALLRIPRLPIEIDTGARLELEKHFDVYRKLSIGIPVSGSDIAGIPESMIFTDGADYTLSSWGRIIWDKCKQMLYSSEFKRSPYSGVTLENSFLNDLKRFENDKKAICALNERLDDLAKYLLTKGKDNPARLYVHQIISKFKEAPNSTEEFYAWSDGGAWRVCCIINKSSNGAVLQRLIPHPKG
ncbi:hypothetical protein AGMMS50276_00230 [Synergistales bacterium]|nr:hypothetical protein AGMMS50276_00230 [Synergistales bacterium]